MAQMRVAVHSRPADINADERRMKRVEWFLFAYKAIEDCEIVHCEEQIKKQKYVFLVPKPPKGGFNVCK
jgi:hypothetical protein